MLQLYACWRYLDVSEPMNARKGSLLMRVCISVYLCKYVFGCRYTRIWVVIGRAHRQIENHWCNLEWRLQGTMSSKHDVYFVFPYLLKKLFSGCSILWIRAYLRMKDYGQEGHDIGRIECGQLVVQSFRHVALGVWEMISGVMLQPFSAHLYCLRQCNHTRIRHKGHPLMRLSRGVIFGRKGSLESKWRFSWVMWGLWKDEAYDPNNVKANGQSNRSRGLIAFGD